MDKAHLTYSEVSKLIRNIFPYAEIQLDDDNELIIHTNSYLNDDDTIRDEYVRSDV